MSLTDEVSDTTDWLNTPLAALAPLENSIRCQVCRDFYTTPMITSCSHTFCSLCIRRYLSQEGRCPACREQDQEIKLRRNWVVEELVTQFQKGREEILRFARNAAAAAAATAVEKQDQDGRPTKRRKIDTVPRDHEPRRSTRSQSRKVLAGVGQSQVEEDVSSMSVEEVQDTDDEDNGSVYEDQEPPEKRQNGQLQSSAPPNDGLVACPICNKRMKETQINAHLDSNCLDLPTTNSPERSNTPQTTAKVTSLAYVQTKPPQPAAPRERLPTINYSMLSEAALRKKLRELNIPSHGSKELMRKRHTEWMNLWNANSDARDPVTSRQLLNNLDRWERTLGRQVDKGPSGVMLKEFDRNGWQKTNRDNFEDLIRKARESRPKHVSEKDKLAGDEDTTGDEPVLNGAHMQNGLGKEELLPNGLGDARGARTLTTVDDIKQNLPTESHPPIQGPVSEHGGNGHDIP